MVGAENDLLAACRPSGLEFDSRAVNQRRHSSLLGRPTRTTRNAGTAPSLSFHGWRNVMAPTGRVDAANRDRFSPCRSNRSGRSTCRGAFRSGRSNRIRIGEGRSVERDRASIRDSLAFNVESWTSRRPRAHARVGCRKFWCRSGKWFVCRADIAHVASTAAMRWLTHRSRGRPLGF